MDTTTKDTRSDSTQSSSRADAAALHDTQTLSVLVENKPGVLTRVSALFARRGFNISSLAVGPTEHPEISRITVVVDVAEQPLEQIVRQLDKLVNVLHIVHLEPRRTVQRELVLVKVGADNATRTSVLEIVQMFRAKVVNAGAEAVTIEATGTEDKLVALLDMLEPFGIREIVKSGAVAISRGPESLVEEFLPD
ncbi:acetolactate synthase small subunit [Brachybacterium kimchii]|uniref:Acetolactate synthase small subunit n=1 Tax=Brachybacterium kimchii TaxID=2942909 RepID=A0ABY4NA75_9MICO|nr:acetolactate synthase small subunit [Brachybacterium kimchii]UQN30274.1 acetolactate synthase small subunit [Brachybacterium kimchii]